MTARVVLARQCRLPTAALAALHDPALAADARRLLAAGEALERLREPVENLLHDLVGGCEDTARRRELLGARRNVHKGVAAARHLPLLEALGADHPELRQWLDAARISRELREPDTEQRRRLAESAQRIVEQLGHPVIRRGIAFASTVFARELENRTGTVTDADSRLSRTAVSYAVRAALKPSPFSSLATLHVPAPPAGDDTTTTTTIIPTTTQGAGASEWCRDFTTFRPLAVELHQICLQRAFPWSGPNPVRARAIPTMRLRGGSYAFLPHYAHQGSLYYRTDELTELTAEAPPVTAASGVATGRLHAQRPWRLTDGHELTALADDGRGRDWPTEVVAALGVAARAERRVHDAERPETLVEAIESLQRGAESALTAVGSRAGSWLLREPLIHESVSGPALPAPGPLPQHLGEVLARRVLPLSFYETLRQVFVALHGSGSAPLVDFCAEVTIALERAMVRPVDRASLADLPHGHLSLARPASVLYFQRSDDRVVINTVMADYLGARSRWGRLATLERALVDDATTTAAERHPGTVAYQFSASTDWTTTQRPGPGLPLAEWGAALLDHPEAVDLARFRVHLDADTRTLQLTDPWGAPASLLYGGAIPPHLLKGVEGVLAVLASPWAVVPPAATPEAVDGGRITPRLESPGVVWNRRTWSLTADVVPTWSRGEHVTTFLSRVEAMRARFAMPSELFVSAATPGRPRPVGKPTWVSLDHPLTVTAALRAADVSGWVFTEALPSAGAAPHATEYVAVVDHG